jgi:sortase (surface protein transpeptidase)
MRRSTRALLIVVAVVLLAGAVDLVSTAVLSGGREPAGPAPSSAPDRIAPPVRAMPRAVPVSLDIPAIAAHSTLIPLGLDPQGALQVPPVQTPMQAGWFTGAPTPGEIGPAIVVGHVDGNRQAGVFYRLDDLRPGEAILVKRADNTTARFAVDRVERIPKAQFPTQRVYGNTAAPDLRLITCGGSFDAAAHSYRDNIIVYAVLRQR